VQAVVLVVGWSNDIVLEIRRESSADVSRGRGFCTTLKIDAFAAVIRDGNSVT
jgi:hypothetical protein